MSKISLQDISSLTNEQSAILQLNQNSAEIEDISDSFLSRDGTSPNQMEADLDMNSNRILNLPKAVSDTEPLRRKELTDFAGIGTINFNTNTELFETRTLVTATTISSSVTYIVTYGYTTVGDQDPKVYIRTASQPSHNGKVQSADGAWWLLKTQPKRTNCTVTGTVDALVLTPIPSTDVIIALTDGMEFSCVPNFTSDTTATITIQIAGFAVKPFKAPDGYTAALWFDIQKGMPLVIKYAAALDVFVIATPPMSFKQSIFGNGQVKLQTSGSHTISLDSNDGQAILMWNPISSSFRKVACPNVTNNNIFDSVTDGGNYVSGVAGSALLTNQLYSVYVFNTDGTNDQAVALDFWPTYLGAGVSGWNPTTNEIGLYVKPIAPGSSAPDNTKTYVGLLWTAGGDVSTLLSGTVIQAFCQSHYNLWNFSFHSDMDSVTGVTATQTLSIPRLQCVTEGIEDLPAVRVSANYKSDGSGHTGSMYLSITGTAFNGSPFTQVSSTSKFTSTGAGNWGTLYCEWGNAVPMGVYTIVPVVSVDGGTGQFDVTMCGVVAN